MEDILTTALTSVQVAIAIRPRDDPTSMARKLPEEILLKIFDLVRHESAHMDGTASAAHSAASLHSLVVATHVCYHWRAVALHCPALWTGIVPHPKLAETFIDRCRDYPLTMSMTVVRGQVSKSARLLLWRLRFRIRRLDISLEILPQLRIFLKTLAGLSNDLEELTIIVQKRRRRLPIGFRTSFPLFGGHVPCLKSLSISCPEPFFPTDRFPDLLALNLSNFEYGRVLTLLSRLMRMAPLLESVQMKPRFRVHVYDLGQSGAFGREGPPHMPKMRCLCLVSLPRLPWDYRCYDSPDLYSILPHIILPPTATVTVREVASYTWVRRAPRMYLPPVGPHAVSILTVNDRGTTVTTRGLESTYSVTYQDRLTAFAVIGKHGLVPPRDTFSSSEALLGTVTVLRIQGAFSWRWPRKEGSRSMLSELLEYTPHLKELVIRDFAREMLPHLTDLLEHKGDTTLCSNLSSVTFITLGSTVTLPNVQGPKPIVDVLLRATAKRAEHGHPLARFVFCSPYVGREYTLQDAHGVENVFILCRDVWDESAEDVDRATAAHQDAMGQGNSQQQSRGIGGCYNALWKRHVERNPPARAFGACGHRRKWP